MKRDHGGCESDSTTTKKAKEDVEEELLQLRKALGELREKRQKVEKETEDEKAKRVKAEKEAEDEKAKRLKADEIIKAVSVETLLKIKKFDLSHPMERKSHTNERYHAKSKGLVSPDFTLRTPNIEELKANGEREYDHFRSKLLQKFVPGCQPTYQSEADICSLISLAVTDAIDILVLEKYFKSGELQVRMERSLFGSRPDMMVVRGQHEDGYLAIEVKRPVPLGKKLVEFEGVLGHVFDHAMAMKAFRMATDLVLLSSFEESVICSLKQSDLETTGQDHKQPQSPAEVKQQTQSLPTMMSPRQEIIPSVSYESSLQHDSSRGDSSSSESSPSSAGCQSLSPIKLHGGGMPTCKFDDGATPRKLHISNTCESHELVKLVYTALKISRETHNQSKKTIYRLRNGESYKFPRALRADKKSYAWGSLKCTVGNAITTNSKKTYYIVGRLGEGRTSNVFLALDSSGQSVALKVYVKNNDALGIILSKKEFVKVAKEAMKREEYNLLKINPCLKGKVKATKILGFWCVAMPFFEPIKKTERGDTLVEIKEVLQRFKSIKQRYAEGDIRWRHVGTFIDDKDEKHVVLYDLADLVPLEGNDDDDAIDPVQILNSKIVTEDVENEGGMFS